jgi:hypothetical protein
MYRLQNDMRSAASPRERIMPNSMEKLVTPENVRQIADAIIVLVMQGMGQSRY